MDLKQGYYLNVTIRTTPLTLNEYYHIYSRGVDRRPIFLDNEDEKRFIRLLYLCNGTKPIVYREVKKLPLLEVERGDPITAIGAYCLMPNHFHLLIKETQEGGITKFMSKLLTAYSSYFNKKYERTGALFSSEFKSEHLDTDEYLKYIFSYIHLNPLKLVDPNWRNKPINIDITEECLDNYSLSSYLDYVGTGREEASILNRIVFPEYFSSIPDFKRNLQDWLSTDLPRGGLGKNGDRVSGEQA